MVWWNKRSKTDGNEPSQELVSQDPRTRVKTTSAATETKNTAVRNSTITDRNKQTVTFMSTRQTVTHTQKAMVTEVVSRRTPSQAELEALFAQMKMGSDGTAPGATIFTTTSRSRPPSLNGVSLRSTQPFKATANNGVKLSTTLLKTEQTTVTRNNGRSVTQQQETHIVDLKGKSKPGWSPFSSSSSNSDSTYVSPYSQNPRLAITHSPTCNKLPTAGNSIQTMSRASPKPADARPVMNLSGSSASTSFGGTRPSTRKSSLDAQGAIKPILPAAVATAKPMASKSKLKPARVYIFNNEKFDKKKDYRVGSTQDVKSLRNSFEQLKCKVEVITDATLAVIRRTVRMLETKDFVDNSALVLVLLSHGTRHDRIAAKDDDYSLDDDVLFPILRNRTLQNKPKLLFVQACKGANELGGFMIDASQPNGSPNEILKCYSTYEGYVSYRTEDGTPFIQTLCEALNRSGKTLDIDSIMMSVRKVVKAQTKDAQIPSVTSTLTSKYIFGDFI